MRNGKTKQSCVVSGHCIIGQKQTRILTVVSKHFSGEDLSEGHSIGVLNFLPHVYQHHTLGVHQPKACVHTFKKESLCEYECGKKRGGNITAPNNYRACFLI